jgi:Cu-processing system permease protein
LTAIVLYGLRESLRRRMFLVVLVLTAAFLALYAYGTRAAFRDTTGFVGLNPEQLDTDTLAGAIVFGLAMFGTLFLGAVLAVFLTLNVVRGDAEAGLLQPLVVRPIGLAQLLVGRFAGAAAVCVVYVLGVYFATLGITRWAGPWTPDRIVTPGLELAAAVVIVAALSLLGSVFLSATANGIAGLMVFGAGLLAGLLGEIGHAIQSHRLQQISRVTWWFLPFDALYEDALHRLTVDTRGFAKFVLELGPFGGSHRAGTPLLLWALAYLVLVGAVALAAFSRRDL